MKVNIITNLNGVGLTRDFKILAELLTKLKCDVRFIASFTKASQYRRQFPEAEQVDVNIFLEHYVPVTGLKGKANVNIFIPNPEWFYDRRYLKKFDLVLAKTRDAERIFKSFGCNVLFTSFTSEDKQMDIEKKRSFIHVGGKSSMKNTDAVFQTWATNPYFDHLFLLRQANGYVNMKNLSFIHQSVEQSQFDQLFAKSLIHLCPSQYEGFGHYIWEAMSASNVVVTTNHAPMNEFITDSRFLVSGRVFKKQGYGRLYQADPASLTKIVESINKMSDNELLEIGKKNRDKWEKNDIFFREIMTKLVEFLRK